MLLSGAAAFVYFGLTHLIRGDDFSFSRTLITCLAYIGLVPWKRFSQKHIYYVFVISSIFCGLNAGYEYVVMDIKRVGIATNPIPYALYCSLLALVSIHLAITSNDRLLKGLAVLGAVMACCALLLTDVRGVILFFPFVAVFLAMKSIDATPRKIVAIVVIASLSVVCSYAVFKTKIDQRIARTLHEVELVEQGKVRTSIGIRFALWQFGMETIKDDVLLGIGDEKLEQGIKDLPNHRVSKQPHLHSQYLDTLARFGVVGLLLLTAFIVSSLLTITDNKKLLWNVSPLRASIVLMIVVAATTDVPFHHTHMVYLFTVLVGVLIMIEGRDEERNSDSLR
ncbi:O-antigen ligase family protein [Enterovibrio norvegicus]|uniref:O-antigen ligase family protein n=1 Tax=Enterovibrio norvegicus TaxID=188144 RepID=UPI0018E9F9E8|nr:O-antigen ligase family protein [Enterovibrio norvegicus]